MMMSSDGCIMMSSDVCIMMLWLRGITEEFKLVLVFVFCFDFLKFFLDLFILLI